MDESMFSTITPKSIASTPHNLKNSHQNPITTNIIVTHVTNIYIRIPMSHHRETRNGHHKHCQLCIKQI